MATTERVMTADELWRLPRDGWRRWLVAGRLEEMAPAGDDHGRYAGVLAALAGYHVLRHKLGAVYAAETGFLLAEAPDTVQAPDWAFVRRERVRPLAGGRRRAGRGNYFPGHPDLAVEVLSPSDRPEKVAEKVQTWLHYGTPLVLLLDARRRRVEVHRPGVPVLVLGEGESLTIDVFEPPLTLPVAALFAETPDL
jgi:Uma2 family endonuclease